MTTTALVLTANDFEETYYGVPVCCSGEEGDLIALGHPGKRRVLAACNRYAREVMGFDNLADDRTVHAADFLNDITERWGVPRPPTDDERRYEGFNWVIEHADANAPGAIPYTFVALA